MRQCAEYLEWISAYVDGELGEAEQIELFVHIEACPACVAALQIYQTMTIAIADMEAAPPLHLVDEVMDEIAPPQFQVVESRPRRRSGMRRFAAVAAVFAVVAVVGVYGVWGGFGGLDGRGGDTGMRPAPVADQAGVARFAAPAAESAETGVTGTTAPEEWGAEASSPDAVLYGELEIERFGGDGLLLGIGITTLFDLVYVSEPWTWADLASAINGAGYAYVLDGNRFTVEVPHRPGNYLFGILDGDLVEMIGYHYQMSEIGSRRVEMRFEDGEPQLVVTHSGG